ncbi:hypothetical protein EKO04_001079 [Ascochyta lentis]|uniref:DUF7587 domain-containing protein n=1 Tax=Ascochyta lentis TaxID=205686 RepID=A0A8H7MHZ3_9PLEO|nr:hypothetical protein EKO04_001079 [Ascochyta lentis]
MGPDRVLGFYATPERTLHKMAHAHFDGKHKPLSPFSSWAASLHLVLCYASSLRGDTYVAVIDTEMVDGEVLVWHVPHLIPESNDEYLAYGVMKGAGFVAVPLLKMKEKLHQVFPELKKRDNYMDEPFSFGFDLRKRMFEVENVGKPDAKMLKNIGQISLLFGDLQYPVATALLCARPWSWTKRDADSGRSVPPTGELERMLHIMKIAVKPTWLESQLPWLQYGAVQTTPGLDDSRDFPDVRQWIDLLHAISLHVSPEKPEKGKHEKSKKRKHGKVVVAGGDEKGSRSKRQATEANNVVKDDC